MDEELTIEIVRERLGDRVSEEYEWPELPNGYRVEFIVFSFNEVIMDFLDPKQAVFWSWDHPLPDQPVMFGGESLNVRILQQCNLPFLS